VHSPAWQLSPSAPGAPGSAVSLHNLSLEEILDHRDFAADLQDQAQLDGDDQLAMGAFMTYCQLDAELARRIPSY